MKLENINQHKIFFLYKQIVLQSFAIVLIAFTIAVTVNLFRLDKIPLIGDWSVDTRFADSTGESLVITFEYAKELFEQKSAIFLDARPKEQYIEGHIQGALSLPWHEVDIYFTSISELLDGYKSIITYCDGESCELSHELALFLKDMGFNNVKVLVNGWTLWNQSGLAVDMGE